MGNPTGLSIPSTKMRLLNYEKDKDELAGHAWRKLKRVPVPKLNIKPDFVKRPANPAPRHCPKPTVPAPEPLKIGDRVRVRGLKTSTFAHLNGEEATVIDIHTLQ